MSNSPALDTGAYAQPVSLWTNRYARPNGLWVVPRHNIVEWAESPIVPRVRSFVHTVAVGPNVCVLRSVGEFDAFCCKYGYIPVAHHYDRVGDDADDFFAYKIRRGTTQHVRPHNLLPVQSACVIEGDDFAHGLHRFMEHREHLLRTTGHEAPFSLRWDRIFADYAGLIVDPRLHERAHVPWYFHWPAGGGIVWDASALRVVTTAHIRPPDPQ